MHFCYSYATTVPYIDMASFILSFPLGRDDICLPLSYPLLFVLSTVIQSLLWIRRRLCQAVDGYM